MNVASAVAATTAANAIRAIDPQVESDVEAHDRAVEVLAGYVVCGLFLLGSIHALVNEHEDGLIWVTIYLRYRQRIRFMVVRWSLQRLSR
jgi:hypothetical protein